MTALASSLLAALPGGFAPFAGAGVAASTGAAGVFEGLLAGLSDTAAGPRTGMRGQPEETATDAGETTPDALVPADSLLAAFVPAPARVPLTTPTPATDETGEAISADAPPRGRAFALTDLGQDRPTHAATPMGSERSRAVLAEIEADHAAGVAPAIGRPVAQTTPSVIDASAPAPDAAVPSSVQDWTAPARRQAGRPTTLPAQAPAPAAPAVVADPVAMTQPEGTVPAALVRPTPAGPVAAGPAQAASVQAAPARPDTAEPVAVQPTPVQAAQAQPAGAQPAPVASPPAPLPAPASVLAAAVLPVVRPTPTTVDAVPSAAPIKAVTPEGDTRRPVAAVRGERPAAGPAAARAGLNATAATDRPAPVEAAAVEAVAVEAREPEAVTLDLPPADLAEAPEVRQPALSAETRAATVSAAAVAAAATTVRGSPETVARLAADIVRKLEGQSTRFDLELDPHGLGKVDVSIEIDREGRLTAALSFDSAQSAADLRGRSGELRQALERAGFEVSRDGLTFDLSGQGAGFGGREAARQERGWNGRAFQRAQSGAEEADASLAAATQPSSRTRSGVDIRI